MSFTVHFPGTAHAPVTLPDGARLSEHLDAAGSPLLFGCRTGICATCLVTVSGAVDPPDDDEREVLDIFAPDDPGARLACQLRCRGDVRIATHPDAV